jgi:acrylyl-CoA reductase (NADPH)
MSRFKAIRVQQAPAGRFARLEPVGIDELTPGDVVVRVAYSSINYKDALAVTGKGAIARGYPRTAGIDLAGVVESSADAAFRPGDRVLATGAGLGESLDGGFAERARLPAAALVPLPAGLSLLEAMALGTAGFTAALALRRLLENHQAPEGGPIAVTGATGGVGSIALGVLKRAGFTTTAITAKPDAAPYLRELGADEVVARSSLASAGKPLETAVWGGAVDNLGGETLAYLTRTVKPWGNIACIGLAQSPALNTTVMPLILRGVSLLGIHSVEVPRAWRMAVWEKLAGEWKPLNIEGLIVRAVIGLEDVPRACEELMAGRARGRYVVRISGDPRGALGLTAPVQ